MKADEIITEARDRILQYIKQIVPTWPDYVVKDWLYPHLKLPSFSNIDDNFLKSNIGYILDDHELNFDSEWQLIPDMKFTMDIWDPFTKRRIEERAGGTKNPHQIPRDAERHTTQAALAKKQGGISKEPVIMVQYDNGYELIEGWHRTIQHFVTHPNGYTGPAYVTQVNG